MSVQLLEAFLIQALESDTGLMMKRVRQYYNVYPPRPPSTFCLPSLRAVDAYYSRQIGTLALPALLSLLVGPILSLVDTAYVGRGLGSVSLAALGESNKQNMNRVDCPVGASGL